MRTSIRNATRPVVVALAMALTATACGGGGEDPLQIGLKRVALDLAFKGEDKDEPKTPPTQALQPLDVPSQAEFSVLAPRGDFQTVPLKRLPQAEACPKATQSDVPDQPVPIVATSPPAVGIYGVHRQGTFAVEGGLFPVRGPMPTKGQKTVSNIKDTTAAPNAATPEPPKRWDFDISETVGENTTTKTLRINGSTNIQLIKQVTKNSRTNTETVFTPTPAVTLFTFGPENTNITGAGSDTASGTSMVVNGKILKREWVDLCGKVYDTFLFQLTERVANLRAGYSSVTTDTFNDPATGTGEGKPNYYWIANHHGGLFIQEEIHTQTQAGALTIKLDYKTTFDSVTPEPLPG